MSLEQGIVGRGVGDTRAHACSGASCTGAATTTPEFGSLTEWTLPNIRLERAGVDAIVESNGVFRRPLSRGVSRMRGSLALDPCGPALLQKLALGSRTWSSVGR